MPSLCSMKWAHGRAAAGSSYSFHGWCPQCARWQPAALLHYFMLISTTNTETEPEAHNKTGASRSTTCARENEARQRNWWYKVFWFSLNTFYSLPIQVVISFLCTWFLVPPGLQAQCSWYFWHYCVSLVWVNGVAHILRYWLQTCSHQMSLSSHNWVDSSVCSWIWMFLAAGASPSWKSS